MGYYYGTLAFICLFILVIVPVTGRLLLRLLRGQEKKKWWVYLITLMTFLIITFHNSAFPLFRDLPNALREDTVTTEGVIETVYFPGGDNGFTIEGTEYRRNPWQFKPEEGKRYRLSYLPHSKYVIDYWLIE